MLSTMQDRPLTIAALFAHGRTIHAGSEVVTCEGERVRRARFTEVAARAERLAAALTRLGVERGDRVGTFGWNTQEHLEAYLAVPSMGAVLHTLNIRLFPEQLAYVANHAEDRVVLVDASCIPLLAPVARELRTVEHFVVIGDGDAAALGPKVLSYAELLAAETPTYDWPALDERHHGESEGRRLQPPLDGPPFPERLHGVGLRPYAVRPRAPHRADVPRQRLG